MVRTTFIVMPRRSHVPAARAPSAGLCAAVGVLLVVADVRAVRCDA